MRACLRFSRRPLPLPFVPPPSNVPDEPPQGLVDGLAVVVAEQVKLMLNRRDDLVQRRVPFFAEIFAPPPLAFGWGQHLVARARSSHWGPILVFS